MFWIREEGQSVTDEKNATRVTTQQVLSDNNIKSTEVSGGRVEQYPVIPHWSVLKWLRHFDCRCCHSVSSQNSSKHRMIMTQRIPVSGNHTMTSRQRKNNKVVPLDPKICERHLELEPLCCSSSCLIRCGCTAIAIFEYIYVLATLTAIILRFHSGGLSQLWPPLKISYKSVATHTILLYIMLAYDLVIVMIATGLLRALLTFDKQIVRMHLCFDYFALAFNVITLIWAITVLRSCLEFFVLVHVLVELAER
ncbi:putative integral membrane protein [Brugia pahangi]